MFLCDMHDRIDKENAYIDILYEQRVEGLVFITARTNNTETLVKARTKGIPLVLCSRILPEEDFDQVGADDYLGGMIATRHLLSIGHRRIAFISGRADVCGFFQRLSKSSKMLPTLGGVAGDCNEGCQNSAIRLRAEFCPGDPLGELSPSATPATPHPLENGRELTNPYLEGYKAALREYNIEFSPDLVSEGNSEREGGYKAVRKLLQLVPRITAVFAVNDLMAIGAMEAIHDAGLRVPEEVAVVGFDNIPMASLYCLGLTTVHYVRTGSDRWEAVAGKVGFSPEADTPEEYRFTSKTSHQDLLRVSLVRCINALPTRLESSYLFRRSAGSPQCQEDESSGETFHRSSVQARLVAFRPRRLAVSYDRATHLHFIWRTYVQTNRSAVVSPNLWLTEASGYLISDKRVRNGDLRHLYSSEQSSRGHF